MPNSIMPDEKPMEQDPVDAAIAARSEDYLLVKRRARFYGWLTLFNLVAFVMVLKGMPLHSLWQFAGPVLGISLVCISATAGRYCIMHLANSFEARKAQR